MNNLQGIYFKKLTKSLIILSNHKKLKKLSIAWCVIRIYDAERYLIE